MTTRKIQKNKLNPKEIKFCKYYVSKDLFCNGVKSYMKVYPKASYDTAKNEASTYLTKPYIIEYIAELLDGFEVTEPIADRELAKLILQDDDKPVKLNALKHFDNLRARIEKGRQKALNENEITKDVITIKLPE